MNLSAAFAASARNLSGFRLRWPVEISGFFIIAVRAMPAAAFTAIPAFKMILFSKNNISFRTVIKVFRVQLFLEHNNCKGND
jgi:hypothetical protein